MPETLLWAKNYAKCYLMQSFQQYHALNTVITEEKITLREAECNVQCNEVGNG